MRIVLQRVSHAAVEVEGSTVGEIGRGVLLLVGFTQGDNQGVLDWMADKVTGLRIFEDEDGKMNRDLAEVDGEILVVSQFTLYGNVRKGRRPSFVEAAHPDVATPLYEAFLHEMEKRRPGRVAAGRFGASMAVSLVNDGPVTLILERSAP